MFLPVIVILPLVGRVLRGNVCCNIFYVNNFYSVVQTGKTRIWWHMLFCKRSFVIRGTLFLFFEKKITFIILFFC